MKATALPTNNERIRNLSITICTVLMENGVNSKEAIEVTANILVRLAIDSNVSKQDFLDAMSDAYTFVDRQVGGGFDA